jgi:hypothetical protein
MKSIFSINQPKTWFIDLDGTLVVHNGYKNGGDVLLDGVKEFFENLPKEDFVIITTSRDVNFKIQTVDFLKKNNIRFNDIIFGLPTGERVLINDKKPDGTITSFSLNINRNGGLSIKCLQL